MWSSACTSPDFWLPVINMAKLTWAVFNRCWIAFERLSNSLGSGNCSSNTHAHSKTYGFHHWDLMICSESHVCTKTIADLKSDVQNPVTQLPKDQYVAFLTTGEQASYALKTGESPTAAGSVTRVPSQDEGWVLSEWYVHNLETAEAYRGVQSLGSTHQGGVIRAILTTRLIHSTLDDGSWCKGTDHLTSQIRSSWNNSNLRTPNRGPLLLCRRICVQLCTG